jgi:P4 family phage/plasmid primase-like protien
MADVRNHEIADFMLSRSPFDLGSMYVEENDTLRYLTESNVWVETSEMRLRTAALDAIVAHSMRNPSPGTIGDIISIAKMRAKSRLQSSAAWHIVFKDGTLDLRTWEIVATDPYKHPAIFYVPYPIADCLDPTRPTPPLLRRFLETTLVEKETPDKPSEPLIEIMQEIFGLCLYPRNPTERAFFFYGTGANGKSVMCDVLTHLLGEERVSPLTLENLTSDRFYIAEISSVLANICREEQSKFINVGMFRKLTTGEALKAQRKFGQPFTFTPRAKFVFAVNNLPTLEDGTDYSIMRRLLIIGFYKTFTEKIEDYGRKIYEEDPAGIFAWALRGLKRLKDRNWNIDPLRSQNVDAMRLEYARANSSVIEYLISHWRESGEGWISNSDLYVMYREWCQKNGHKPKAQRNFVFDLKKAFPSVREQARLISSITGTGIKARCRNLEPIPEFTDEEVEESMKASDPFSKVLD